MEMSRRLVDHENLEASRWLVDCKSGNLERIDDWSTEAGYCIMEQKAMMDHLSLTRPQPTEHGRSHQQSSPLQHGGGMQPCVAWQPYSGAPHRIQGIHQWISLRPGRPRSPPRLAHLWNMILLLFLEPMLTMVISHRQDHGSVAGARVRAQWTAEN